MVKEPPPLACSSSRVTVDDIVIVAVVYRRVLNAGSSAAVGRILTIGGATVESHFSLDHERRWTCFRSAPQDSCTNRRRFWTA